MNIETTKKEEAWIRELKALMKRKPKTLWLFNTGTMYVMKCGENGKEVMTRTGGVDQSYCIAQISGVLSEGGDW